MPTMLKPIEKDKKVYIAFVDLEKVYNNVSRESYGWRWRSMGWKESCLGQSKHYMMGAGHV